MSNTSQPIPLIFDDDGSQDGTTTLELPTVSLSADRTAITEGGEAQLLTFNLSEPAPAGGLVVNINIDDPDGEGADTEFPPELISNIVDFGQVEEDGIITASLTIAEGSTEATFGISAIEDDLVEGEENYSLTLLENENYIADLTSTTITTTIEDNMTLPTVSITPETIIATEGDSLVWNYILDRPVPEGGLTLNLVITQDTESSPDDGIFNLEASSGITDSSLLLGNNEFFLGVSSTLAEGVTQAQFVVDTVIDDILETDEISSVTLADGENYLANPNQNTIDFILTDRTVVSLTTDEVNVTEGDTFAWNFSLNRPAPVGGLTLSLPITLNNDPAPGDVNYNVEGSNNIEDFGFITQDDVSIGFTLTIPEGETDATLVSEAVVDDVAEFDEIFTTVLADGNDYVANPVSNQVVTTIVEDGESPVSSVPVVSITPSALISTEGDTFAWNFTLDQPVPEGGLTLNLPITQNNDPAPGDVIYNVEGSTGITDFDFIVEDDISIGFSVTLEEGVESATLVSQAVADDNDLEESADEIFTTVLADGVDYRANPDSNEVQTILTGQPVVTLTPEQVNVTEGDTFAWNFSLNQPAPEGGLNLTLPITLNNDPAPGDVNYNVEGSTNIANFDFLVIDDVSLGFNVTIAEGETEATLVSQAVADDVAEIDEIFTTVLNDGEDYRANPLSKEVVTTIVEQDSASTPVVSFNTDKTVISEGGEAQLITFNLSEPAPVGGLPIKLQIDDPDGEPGDTDNALELFSNVTDFNDRVEDGVFVANITIAEDATEATIGIKALADNQVEGNETYSLTLLENDNYIVDSDSTTITTTIEDNMTLPTVSLTPETLIATEGDSLVRNIVLDRPVPEGGLTLNLVVTQNTESTIGELIINQEASRGITDSNGLIVDGVALGVTVTLAEGITQAQLVADTVADDIPETDEIITITLADGDNYRANPDLNNISTVFTDRTVVTLSTDEVNVTEGDTFAWNFSLNQPAPVGGLTLSLPITLNNDPEPGDVNYNVEGSTNIEDFGFITQDDVSIGFTLTIPEGATDATSVSEAVTDDIAEFDEIFTTVLADGNDYVANPVSNQVVTTIVEDGESPVSSVPVVSITPSALISTEGDTFAWNFTLDQPVPEGGLTLNLPITQNNDPAPGDVEYNVEGSTGITDFDFIVEDNISIGFSVTLEEGVTSATLVSEAVADDNDLDDSADEIFTTVLADGVDYRANPDSNEVVTVLTREPVVTLTPEQVNVAEGDTFAWNFSLNKPAPEGGLNLSLPITFNNDPEPGDVIYNVEGSTNITDFSFLVIDNVSLGFDVTIAEGATEATLVSQAVADDVAEIDEIFTTVLADGGNYRANPSSKEVVTTIVEQDSASDLPTISVVAEPTEVAEGSQLLWNFGLTEAVGEGGLTVALDLVEDTDPLPGDINYFVDGSENVTDFELVIDEESGLIDQALVTLAEGATEATLVNDIIADNVTEGEESVSFALAESDDYAIDSEVNAASFTILDTSTGELPTISVFAEPTEVNEGSQLLWNFGLTEAVGNGGLTVALDLVEDTDPLPGDINYFVDGSENVTDFELVIDEESGLIDQALVTLAEGATEATLVNDIIADNVTEGEESVSFALAESEEYIIDSEDNAASFTIIDTSTSELPTISVFAEPTEVNEGSQLLWNFSLTEAVGNGGLTVALDLVEDTDPLPGDITYFVEGSENVTDFELVIDEESGLIEQALVTLAEGATEATLVSDIIADNATEGAESVSFALAESDDYAIDSEVNAASFTILDTSTDLPDVIDLTSFTVEVSATSNAGFINIGGFYQALDTEGTVIDPMTGNEVTVGDEGYEDAALANSVVQIGDGEDATLELEGGFAYVPYLLANGMRFFTDYAEANADGLDHVQSAGENTFGFEDLLGGGDNDFNDYIISFDIV